MADKGSNKVEKRKPKIQRAVLLRTLIPMFIMGIIIAYSAARTYENNVKNESYESLENTAALTATLFDQLYPGDYELVGTDVVSLYKGEKELTGDFELIDKLKKETGKDITIFYGNTRILTTLKDEDGNRYIRTGLNAGAFGDLLENKQVIYSDVDIEGNSYYACYYPLVNTKSEYFCVIGVAEKASVINKQVQKSIMPVWGITILCMAVATAVNINYTKSMIDSIEKIEGFLVSMTGGELSTDMPSYVLKRDDELGHVSKSLLEMQNAIRVLVERDALTGLYNRRYGSAKFRKMQSQAERSGMPYAVVLGDIDFFKKVNDTYGHEAGDIVLKKVSEILRKSMTGKGFAARWGGEEFLLIFNKAGFEQAANEVERTLQKIRDTEILYKDQMIHVTMTFGVIDGGVSKDYAELLRKADERLYNGKMHGRNRVVRTDDLPEEEYLDVKREDVTSIKTEDKQLFSETSDNSIKARLKAETETIESLIESDEFLTQLIEKMSEKLYSETLEDIEATSDKEE